MFPVAILAGGLATRLKPLSDAIPKALLDVNGMPFIAQQLGLLRRNGITQVVVCAGYLGEMIQARIGDGAAFGVRLHFVFDGARLLGTAGALKHALPWLGENFFVLYGDSYLPCDYARVQHAFRQQGKPALMTVFKNDGRWDQSNVEFANGQIVAYEKHAPTARMEYIDYGLGVFARAAFDLVPADQPFDLAVLYQTLLRRKQLGACQIAERFYEIGSFAGLEETRRYLAQQELGK